MEIPGKPQLFLIHFAGGNEYSFRFMIPYLKNFEVIPLELPGRGNRIKEPLLTDYERAADDIYQQIVSKQSSSPYLIYGHSLGAYLTLTVANKLEKINRAPACIIVSGNPGPGVRENRKRYLFEQDEFIKELRRLGAFPEQLIENKELFSFFEPILRADFELAEKEDVTPAKAINIPIYALMGSTEENTDKIENWKRFTNSGFQSEILEGNHFFIFKHGEYLARIMDQCYKKARMRQKQLTIK